MSGSARVRGFTLLETTIAIVITGVVASAAYLVVRTAIKGDEALRLRVIMQLEAAQAMREIGEALKSAGPIDLNANGKYDPGEYPVFSSDRSPGLPGLPQVGFSTIYPFSADVSSLKTIVPQAKPGDPDYGPSVQIAFRRPQIVDPVNYPYFTDQTSGAVNWGDTANAAVSAYYVLVLARGVDANEIQLREYNGAGALLRKKTLARGVERIIFEARGAMTPSPAPTDFLSPGLYDPTLGKNQLRLTVWFRRKDINQRTVSLQDASTISLRSVER